ncbi:MAG TPA: VOC family protein [Pyrinomonadaceae bacterium]|nr:VOC family protein [Pyrinomonadaceae bacterium]
MDSAAQAEVGGVSPFFIVRNVPAALAFYRDRLGFEITFQGPFEDDIFFGIVQRGRSMIMFKAVGVDPLPNCKREAGARWDAYFYVPDPDALAAEFASRKVEFLTPLGNNSDDLRGFEIEDGDGYVLYFGRPNRKDEGSVPSA